MATAARKKQFRNDDIEKILPLKESINTIEKAEKTLHDIDEKGLEIGAKAAESYCDIMRKLGSNMPGMMELIIDSMKLYNTLYRVRVEMNEFYHKLANDYVLVAREMIGCQSSDEFYTLQRMAMNQLSKRCIEEVSRMNCMVFGGFEGFCVLPPD